VVEKRLHNRAEKDIPRPKMEVAAYKIERWFWVLLVLSAFSGLPFYSPWTLGLYIGLPILVPLVIKGKLAKPLRERQEEVALRQRELAEERKKKQEEEQVFYSSPEWAKVRELVIKEDGKVCAQCHRYIKNDSDVTVDHIRPRSKYLDLALKRENLRVLCRRCNSIKKDKELVDL